MSDLIWLTESQMRRIKSYFPLSHGIPGVVAVGSLAVSFS